MLPAACCLLVHVYVSACLAAVMVLVGNKTDLAEQRQVTEEEARAFADRWAGWVGGQGLCACVRLGGLGAACAACVQAGTAGAQAAGTARGV